MLKWNEVATRFERVTDKLGKRIDTGIFETVVAFNMAGIPTRASCEGHLDWGLPYPWVDIEDKTLIPTVYSYLRQFYQERSPSFEMVLSFHGCRLQSHICWLVQTWDDEERAHWLEACRAEMTAFTRFLKARID
jgi:hypothetical protein